MGMSSVMIVGRIGKDPEMKYTPTGTAVTNFSVAVDGYRKDADGNKQTDWFDVVAFGKTAEFVAQYVDKGARVSLRGRLQQEKWTTPEGQSRSRVSIVADQVQSEETRSEAEGRRAGGNSADAPKPVQAGAAAPAGTGNGDYGGDPWAE